MHILKLVLLHGGEVSSSKAVEKLIVNLLISLNPCNVPKYIDAILQVYKIQSVDITMSEMKRIDMSSQSKH